jgi:2-iminoacetate synthase
MAVQAHPPLSFLAEWIRATDEHAPDRLQLVEQVESVLSDRQSAPPEDRLRLAQRLERWRYQCLSRRAGALTPEDRRLVDALDLAANELAGRDPRPARAARAAIENAPRHDATEAEVMRCLDPAADLSASERRAAAITHERFGVHPARASSAPPRWRMLLYAPLYLSNYCINHCVYCGFRYPNAVERKHLSGRQAVREAEILMGRGFRHILLVAGDFPRLTATEYYAGILRALKARGAVPAVEIAPQSTGAYAVLIEAGACGLTLFQETYNEGLYAAYHPRGSKVSFDWRLEGCERAAEAGMPRIGLGILLGLADPREDLIAMVRHARYLKARFPDRTLAFSLPRIHDAPAGFRSAFPVDDDAFLRMYCALRIAFPEAELVLSTREPAALRNRLAAICITQMSAGSCTAPGGYVPSEGEVRAGEQFAVCDRRSPAEVASWLRDAGFEPLWQLPR